MKLLCIPLLALGFLLPAAMPALAQNYNVRAGNFNRTFIAPATVPVGSNQGSEPATANSNFSGVGSVAGSSGPIDSTPSLPDDGAAINPDYFDRYPSNPANTFVLKRSTAGGAFSAGAARYFMGDEITPPLADISGAAMTLNEARDYWRAKPALPGESVPGLGIVITIDNVMVTSAPVAGSLDKKTVSISTRPASLIVGATLLGQPVTVISGTGPWTVTLAGDANETITAITSRPVTPATPYYYSPHANRVFASQPGQVTMKWVTRAIPGSPTLENSTKDESFFVSGNSQIPVRTIYWSEGSFNGPIVQITDARVTTVNPAHNATVPKAVAEEVDIPGYTPLTPNLKTLYFEKFNGSGQLHAHNVEGLILIEYLGNVRLGNDIHESLGIDVVEIKREPDVYRVAQHLGTELSPRVPAEDGDELLTASPVLNTAQGGATYYGTTVRADNSQAYYAERETSPANDPDDGEPASSNAYNKVVFYWMEEFPDNFGIKWPKFQTRYWQRWSPNLADYAHYSVEPADSTAATGVSFPGGSLPTLVWQDDPAQAEASIDINTQRLFVNFAPNNPYKRNRSLLKFTSSGRAWYVNLYTQAENLQTTRSVSATGTTTVTLTGGGSTIGLEAGMIVTGTGIPGGSASIVSITDHTHFVLSETVSTSTTYTFAVESDALAPINAPATVGTRLAPPSGHELAGYISGGTNYFPGGYLNPFTVGVPVANLGAIIPVNDLPGNNLLTVRWFKKVTAPGSGFPDFYVPGKIGRYTVSFPSTTTPQIVIAEGVGTGDLDPEVIAGSLYYQNDKTQPGYNPNEEHAVMIGTRAYALRDDLNMIAPQQSKPFVLIAYTNPADLRPDMNVYKVVREVDNDSDRAARHGPRQCGCPAPRLVQRRHQRIPANHARPAPRLRTVCARGRKGRAGSSQQHHRATGQTGRGMGRQQRRPNRGAAAGQCRRHFRRQHAPAGSPR